MGEINKPQIKSSFFEKNNKIEKNLSYIDEAIKDIKRKKLLESEMKEGTLLLSLSQK